MKKKIINTLMITLATVMLTETSMQTSATSSIGDELTDSNLLLDEIRDRLSYFLDYDTTLNDEHVISVTSDKGDIVPDGKGPSGNKNPKISSLENPISLKDKDIPATYNLLSNTFELLQLEEDYYTFLGWSYDYSSIYGEMIDKTSPDFIAKLDKHMKVEKGCTGSRHYTGYWRQNYLTVRLNAGCDINGNKAVLGDKHKADFRIDESGHILSNGNEKIHLLGAEDTIDITDLDDEKGLNLFLKDYHIEKGKEWVGEDGRIFDESKIYFSTDIAPKLKDGDLDKTFTANWIPNEYVISYDFGNIAPETTDTSIYMPRFEEDTTNSKGYAADKIAGDINNYRSSQFFDLETKGELPKPSISDYEFKGWFTDDDSEVKTYEDVIAHTIADKRDILLTAKWEPKEYDIIYLFDKNALPEKLLVDTKTVKPQMGEYEIKGSHNDYSSKEMVNAEKKGDLPVPRRKYYNFLGWYLGESKVSTFKEILDNTKEDDRNCTLKALWEPVKYNITYSFGELDVKSSDKELFTPSFESGTYGTYPLSEITGEYNNYSAGQEYSVETLGNIPAAMIKGYTFAGWFTNDERIIKNYEDIPYEEGIKDIKLTARWEKCAMEANLFIEGLTKPTSKDITTSLLDKSVTKAMDDTDAELITCGISIDPENGDMLPIPTRDGYSFTGWEYNGEKVETYADAAEKKLKSDGYDIIAGFEPVKYKLTYKQALAPMTTTEHKLTDTSEPTLGTDYKAENPASNYDVKIGEDTASSTYTGENLETEDTVREYTVEVRGELDKPSRTCYVAGPLRLDNSIGEEVSTYEEIIDGGNTILYTEWEPLHEYETYNYSVQTCFSDELDITYCKLCGNVSKEDIVKKASPHDMARHTHLIKDANGTITQYKTPDDAGVNKNYVYGGAGTSAGSGYVKASQGGAGTCYTRASTITHEHSASCRSGKAVMTGTITQESTSSFSSSSDKIPVGTFGLSSGRNYHTSGRKQLDASIQSKYFKAYRDGNYVVTITEANTESSSGGNKCPQCRSTTEYKNGHCRRCGYYDDMHGGSSMSGQKCPQCRSSSFDGTKCRSCGYEKNKKYNYTVYKCGCGWVEGSNSVYYLTCTKRHDVSCTEDGHDVYTCKKCGTVKDNGYQAKLGHAAGWSRIYSQEPIFSSSINSNKEADMWALYATEVNKTLINYGLSFNGTYTYSNYHQVDSDRPKGMYNSCNGSSESGIYRAEGGINVCWNTDGSKFKSGKYKYQSGWSTLYIYRRTCTRCNISY